MPIYPRLQLLDNPRMHRWITDNARAPVNLGLARLKLWLDKRHYPGIWRQQGNQWRQDEAQGDERNVDHRALDGFWQRCDEAHIGMLHHYHARVVAQRPGQLPAPDIDCIDSPRPVLEQAIGEPARRSPDIEGDQPIWVECESLQRLLQLQAAPADVFQFAILSRDTILRVKWHQHTRLIDLPVAEKDLARHDERARPFAAGSQAAPHQRQVQPFFVRRHYLSSF